MAASKTAKLKRLAALTALTLTVTGFFIVKSGRLILPLPIYQAISVVDGDTFITKEKQNIRLASVSAPELDLCGGQEAKQALQKLIMGQPLYLKVVFNDRHKRLVADVYTPNGSVSEQMLSQGWAYHTSGLARSSNILSVLAEEAKTKKLGIYSKLCTQAENEAKPNCIIKANIPLSNPDHKTYRFPGCGQYQNTTVQLYLGDQWFCSEKEAQKAGFVKASDCFEKSWPR